MSELQGMPYVPGTARGILRRGPAATPGSILLLTQAEAGTLQNRPAGIIVVDGAPFSHPMIHLFGLGVPVVMVNAATAAALLEGQDVFLDGSLGQLVQPPDQVPVAEVVPAPPPSGQPVATADGLSLELRASVSGVDGAGRALALGATAIGLVRSEFLLPADGRQPDVGFYTRALGELCEAAWPLSLTVRLPDIAVDKPVPWLSPLAGMAGPLGLQGARLYDREPLRSVCHAILDAVAGLADRYALRLLVPYVSDVAGFRRRRSGIAGHHPVLQALPVGAMAETPAAVLALPDWFDVADFVAIGCNDLMQCLFAADRDLPEVRDYLDPYAPVLYRFLRQAAAAAGTQRDRVQLCGLLPQLPGVLPVLIGLGFRAFSVEPVMLPWLAQITREMTLAQAEALAQQVCEATDSRQVRELLRLPEQGIAPDPGL